MIKVLVVDDSSFFRRRITEFLSADSDIEVIGQAVDGLDAIDQSRGSVHLPIGKLAGGHDVRVRDLDNPSHSMAPSLGKSIIASGLISILTVSPTLGAL